MSIFSRIFGDEKLSSVEDYIDKVISVNNQNSVMPPSDEQTASSVVSFLDVLSKADKKSKDEIGKLFDNVSVPRERLLRYDLYEELYRTVPLIKRILRVYRANILQKNPVTGKSLLLKTLRKKEVDDGPEKFKARLGEATEFVEDLISRFRISEKLSTNIIPRQLLYGDCFVEVVNVKKEDFKIKSSGLNYLSEIRDLNNFLDSPKGNVYNDNYLDTILERFSNLLIEFEDEKNGNDEKSAGLDDIVIKIHKPHSIVILQTEYGTRLGYLEISKSNSPNESITPDVGRLMASAVSKINSLSMKSSTSNDKLVNRLVSFIIRKLVDSSKKKLNISDTDVILKSFGNEIYNFIKKLIIEQGDYNNFSNEIGRVKTRFIPTNRMIHFTLPSADNLPYGESIVDPLILPAKLCVLSQLANIITKLSRASLVRTWTIETGASLMHSELAQQLKRELYNSRITLEDLGSFKTVPKILSDYKDMFLFSRGGQKSVDVDIRSYGDAAIKVADLEDARRELIALSGIPAPYLGYMDVVELREQLVHSNVSFATEITDIQENINNGLDRLIDIIAELTNFPVKPSEYVSLCTIPPIVLLLQLTEMTISSAGNIMNVFAGIDVPFDPYFFLEKYVPYLDWNEFKEAAEDRLKFKATQAELVQPQQ